MCIDSAPFNGLICCRMAPELFNLIGAPTGSTVKRSRTTWNKRIVASLCKDHALVRVRRHCYVAHMQCMPAAAQATLYAPQHPPVSKLSTLLLYFTRHLPLHLADAEAPKLWGLAMPTDRFVSTAASGPANVTFFLDIEGESAQLFCATERSLVGLRRVQRQGVGRGELRVDREV